jgi:hypothetical protein
VIVNRVWAHHFGRGLVETVSDFGAQGERPSHPELLDDLTCRFIEQGWSLKWLHREIMTTAAYQQSSEMDAANFAADPDNRWLWRPAATWIAGSAERPWLCRRPIITVELCMERSIARILIPC